MNTSEKLVFPSLESKGKIFTKQGAAVQTVNGEKVVITEGQYAEKWSNGTIFALVNGAMRRLHPYFVEYVAA